MNSKNTIEISNFGTSLSGEVVKLFTIKTKKGLIASITDFGGIVTKLLIFDREENLVDIVLGFNDIETYLEENIYAGAIVGRIAGRLAKGQVVIDGEVCQLTLNEGENHLHGGHIGFDKRIWHTEIIEKDGEKSLKLTYLSPDGEEGFPGNLNTSVIYSLTDEKGLEISYEAHTDKTTPLCLTNHIYFNLEGENSGRSVLNHELQIEADVFIETNKKMMPTGKILPVSFEENDFRESRLVGEIFKEELMENGDNYLLHKKRSEINNVAVIKNNATGIQMKIFTTTTNLQIYPGTWLQTKKPGKSGFHYKKYGGICFECQGFSDAMSHKGFESILLEPNEKFEQVVAYKFSNFKIQ